MAQTPQTDPNSANSTLSEVACVPRTATSRAGQQRKRAVVHQPEEMAEVRRAKQRRRARMCKLVDAFMDRAEVGSVHIPLMYVYVARSLTAATLLYQIDRICETQYKMTGNPWRVQDEEFWLQATGLTAKEWMDARDHLRFHGLIEERRRFDLASNSIVVEVQFVPDEFCKAKAELRDEVRELYRDDVARDLPLPFGIPL